MDRSDSRSALAHFAGTPLIGLVAPRQPRRWHRRGLSAGAETGLSCSHTSCPTLPRPLRRRVPRGCASQLFTPSVAFAWRHEARLPVGPLAGENFTTRQASLHAADGWLAPSSRRLDPALQRPGLPRRWRAAAKVAGSLLWRDFHPLV